MKNLTEIKVVKEIYKAYFKTNEFIPSGFKKLDSATGVFKKKEVTIIGGLPSIGKTSFCVSLCRNILISQPYSLLYITLELSSLQLFQRFVLQNNSKTLEKINNSSLSIWSPDLGLNSFSTFKQTICEHNKEKGLDLIIIDYAQLLPYNENTDNLFLGLKQLAEETNTALIVLSQLERTVDERNQRQPVMKDLLDINGYDKNIHNVCFLHSPISQRKSDRLNLTIAKNSRASGKTIKLRFDSLSTNIS